MKKVQNQGAPLRKMKESKMAVCGVKIEVFDLFSYFGFYFLAESVKLDGFHAKKFIF